MMVMAYRKSEFYCGITRALSSVDKDLQLPLPHITTNKIHCELRCDDSKLNLGLLFSCCYDSEFYVVG